MGYVSNQLTPFTSGRDGSWTPIIECRLDQLRVPEELAEFVSSHVEMKVATMMITCGIRLAELVINHMPCGSRLDQRAGCHQVLEQYLPKRYTLAVHGTTQLGDPFSNTYRGRA